MVILGFFDHGVPGEFSYFSLAHFMPLLVMGVLIYLSYRYRNELKNWKHEYNLRIVMALILLLSDNAYFWHKMYIGADIANHLPVTVCGWATIMSAFLLLTKKQGIFDVVYFFVLAGSINALITPAVITDNGPTHFRYYQFWTQHTMIFIATFYMLFVHSMRINFMSMVKSFAVLVFLAILAIYVNANIEGANYLFLATTEAGDSVLNFLPSNLGLRLLIMGAVIGTLYFLAYLPWIFINRKNKIKNT